MSLAKVVIGGTGVVTVAAGTARLLAILTVPILSRLLGPASYGAAALVGSVVSLASVMASLGIDMAYTRFYLQEHGIERIAVERFCWRFAAGGSLVSGALVGAVWYCIGDRWLPNAPSVACYIAIVILMTGAAIMATARMRLFGNYRRIAVSCFAASLVSTVVSIGVAVAWRQDEWALMLGTCAASAVTLVTIGLPAKTVLSSASHLSPKTQRAVLALGLAGSVTAPMYWVISSADRWFISQYVSNADVGVYSMAAGVATLGLMLNTSITVTWFPEASRAYGEMGHASLASLGRLWSQLVVMLAIAWLSVAAAGGDVLRLLAAPVFHDGAKYVLWLAGGVFFYGVASLASTTLMLESKMRYVAYSWMLGAIVCIALNSVLVPQFGALGAAMSQCVSYSIIAFSILAIAHRVLPLPIPVGRLALSLTMTLSAGLALAHPWADSPSNSLLVKCPFGLLIAMTVLRLVAQSWYHALFTRLLKVLGRAET